MCMQILLPMVEALKGVWSFLVANAIHEAALCLVFRPFPGPKTLITVAYAGAAGHFTLFAAFLRLLRAGVGRNAPLLSPARVDKNGMPRP